MKYETLCCCSLFYDTHTRTHTCIHFFHTIIHLMLTCHSRCLLVYALFLPPGFGVLWVDRSLCWCTCVVSRLVPPHSPIFLFLCLLTVSNDLCVSHRQAYCDCAEYVCVTHHHQHFYHTHPAECGFDLHWFCFFILFFHGISYWQCYCQFIVEEVVHHSMQA